MMAALVNRISRRRAAVEIAALRARNAQLTQWQNQTLKVIRRAMTFERCMALRDFIPDANDLGLAVDRALAERHEAMQIIRMAEGLRLRGVPDAGWSEWDRRVAALRRKRAS